MPGKEAGAIIYLASMTLHNFHDQVTSVACKVK